MKIQSFFIPVVFLVLSTQLFAQNGPAVAVDDFQICTSVENRQPVGSDTSFTADVGQLYCFTKLTSSQDTTTIAHVWYHNDEEMAQVPLTMRAKAWRTWSSKKIDPGWTGAWRVDILSADGKVIASKKFTVK